MIQKATRINGILTSPRFFILPWVSGNVQSELLSKDFGIDPADFITSLNGTFMIDAELSKGKFFAAPSYIFNYNEFEKILWTSNNGNQTITAQPEYQRHILEVITGMRFRFGSKFILDPYAGFKKFKQSKKQESKL